MIEEYLGFRAGRFFVFYQVTHFNYTAVALVTAAARGPQNHPPSARRGAPAPGAPRRRASGGPDRRR